MLKSRIGIGALLAVLLLAGCGRDDDTQPVAGSDNQAQPSPLAEMGEVSLSGTEFSDALAAMAPAQRQALEADKDRLQAWLRGAVLRKYVVKQAEDEGWSKRQDVQLLVQREANRLIYRQFLAGKASVDADYPPEADIQAVYDRNKASFLQSGSVHLAQIFLAKGEASTEVARTQAEGVLDKLNAGVDFADLARQLSEHQQSAAQGGEMGWIAVNKLQPAIRKVIAGNKVGDIIGPVETHDGWHVLKIEGFRPSSYLPLDQVRDRIRALLRQKALQQSQLAYLTEQARKHPVSVDHTAFQEAVGAVLQDQEPADGTLATMGKVTLGSRELLAGLKRMNHDALQVLHEDADKAKSLLANIITRKFVLEQAVAEDFPKRPEVQAAVARLRDRVIYASYVRAKVLPEPGYPSEKQLQTAFDNNSLELPVHYSLLQMNLARNGDDSAARLEKLRQSLASPPKDGKAEDWFRKAAGESDRPVQELHVAVTKLLPQVRQMIGSAKAGDVVGPIELPQGWVFLLVRKIESARKLTLEEARPLLVRMLRQRQAQENEKSYLARLAQEHPIKIDAAQLENRPHS